MVFCNKENKLDCVTIFNVTILILIDGFLQFNIIDSLLSDSDSHNPYFNRWFSAIYWSAPRGRGSYSHNPYFNRWFSAMLLKLDFLLYF